MVSVFSVAGLIDRQDYQALEGVRQTNQGGRRE